VHQEGKQLFLMGIPCAQDALECCVGRPHALVSYLGLDVLKVASLRVVWHALTEERKRTFIF
jgi:hypothetical protein